VLLAVIFSFDSAPDSRMGKESWDSQNNSAVFSRISAISGIGTPACGIISDGETGRGKCMSLMVDRGNSRRAQNSPSIPFLFHQPIVQPICLPIGAISGDFQLRFSPRQPNRQRTVGFPKQ